MSAENDFIVEIGDLLSVAKREYKIPFPRLRMMIRNRGVLPAVKRLLDKKRVGFSSGFLKLIAVGRLDLTIEHIVLKPKYEGLFSPDELAVAKQRYQMAEKMVA